MTEAATLHQILRPERGAQLAPAPWTCNDEGVITDAAGRCVCVLGPPFDGLEEQDLTNGAAVLALPELIAALVDLLPYAQAAIGLPRQAWPADSVVLKAEAALAKAGALSVQGAD